MSKIKLRGLAFGDPHLERFSQSFLGPTFKRNAVEEQLNSLERACEYAISKKIKFIFILGDITDTPRMKTETMIALISLIRKFEKLTFYFITGNHEVTAAGKHVMELPEFLVSAQMLSNAHVFSAPKMEIIEGFPVYFMPYGFNEQPNGAYLGIGHHSVTGAAYENGFQIGDEGISIKNKRSKWIMGHIHQYQEHDWGLYAGTAYQIDFGEHHKKYFIEFEATLSEGKVRLMHTKVKTELPFRLRNKYVRKQDQFQEVPQPDGFNFYKVFHEPELTVPASFRVDFPNVVKVIPIDKNGKEMKITKVEEAPADVFKVRPTDGLKEYLARRGWDEEKIKVGVSFVKKLSS